MRGNRIGHQVMLGVAAVSLAAGAAGAQVRSAEEWLDRCADGWGSDREVHCLVKEQTLPARGGVIAVEGGQNGGISVRSWDRDSVLVRAKIQGWGDSEDDARRMAEAVRLVVDGRISADGPSRQRGGWWAASFELYVPARTNLDLETHNGGIGIENITGDIRFNATNGGISLSGLGGNVRGRTTNGGLAIELTGDRWAGEQLDVVTTNGGVRLTIPERYNARLETGTTNGFISIDFPITVQGQIGRKIATTLGEGGPLVRVMTTNGAVKVRRR